MLQFGFCALSAVPVRAEASERSEMINQLLFGETFEIIDSIDEWKVTRGSLDKYEGFIDNKQILHIPESEYQRLNNAGRVFPKELVSEVTERNYSSCFNILFGSPLPGFMDGKMKVGDCEYHFKDDSMAQAKEINPGELITTAKKYLGAPYLWGGRSPFGIDCSGFMQVVFNMHGVTLYRDASCQAKQGTTLILISEAEPGDIAFFDNEEGQIIHVGMIIENEKIIHASGQVRIDKIDHYGIYNEELQKYTHKLRLIKRVLLRI